jgi:tRNA threonylcarbamoyladenosine modification (KEOPS) complex  Pcc1 subunit
MKLPEAHTTSNLSIKAHITVTALREEASAIYRAILPESSIERRHRGDIKLRLEDQRLTIEIVTKDISLARALIGSYLRLIKAAYSAINEIKK